MVRDMGFRLFANTDASEEETVHVIICAAMG